MKAKINLSIDERLVYKIKAYAEEKHTSVSELVEEYFKRTVEKTVKMNNLIDLVKSLPKVELPYADDVDLKKQYYEEQASKYGF
ncbi:DUF6364 family protein [Pedobacter sp. P351]|uniref:DUF6364 family protein n=1 Tax=Pedobacter superstes TaxID=3133441 RepID=UPI0030ACD13D